MAPKLSHNPKVASSNLAPATKHKIRGVKRIHEEAAQAASSLWGRRRPWKARVPEHRALATLVRDERLGREVREGPRPGRRLRWSQPLAQVGYGGDAWAEVRRVGGSGRFVAYGVVHDNVTADGTLLPMTAQR